MSKHDNDRVYNSRALSIFYGVVDLRIQLAPTTWVGKHRKDDEK